MPSQKTPDPDPGPDLVLERLHSLFEASPEAVTQLRELLTHPLAKKRITSTVPDDELAQAFVSAAVPEGHQKPADYFTYLREHVVPHGMNVASPRFIGHMATSLPKFTLPLAELLTAMNQNVVKMETSKVFTFYERQALAMLHGLAYRQPESFYETHTQARESTLGLLVSGGTLANIAALWCARNRALGPDGDFHGIEREGSLAALRHYDCKGAVIIAPSLVHYSIGKAAGILGIGTDNLRKVPVRSDGTIAPEAVRAAIKQAREDGYRIAAVIGIAGTTETGAVDPIDEIADVAADENVHLHVDAAWGGPVLFSERHRPKLCGIERADSICIDAHKQLYMPMGMGVVLFKDPAAATAIEKSAAYIVRTGTWDLGRRTLEGSRPGTALFLHAALNIVGRAGYECLIDAGIGRAERMAEEIRRRAEFQLLTAPTLNILTYRYVPPELRGSLGEPLSESQDSLVDQINQGLQEMQKRRGEGFISRTTLSHTPAAPGRPITCLRAVLANPLTTAEDIGAVLNEQVRIGDELVLEHSNGRPRG